MKKKLVILLLVSIFALHGCGDSKTPKLPASQQSAIEDDPEEELPYFPGSEEAEREETKKEETKKEETAIKSGSYDIAGETFQFSDSVMNDVTGKWRLSRIASSILPEDYAVDYYHTLFSSDDEIHAIVNFSLNTTTSISVLYDGMLYVHTHEYVDKEEHDAKSLFGGMLLSEYWINIETGEIETIQ